jgi:hypothetical protein
MLTLSVRIGRCGRLGAAMSYLLGYLLSLWFAPTGKPIDGYNHLASAIEASSDEVYIALNIQQN